MKKLDTSNDTKKLLESLTSSGSLMKVKVSWVLCIDGSFDCNKLQKHLARLQLKLFIDETIGRRGGTLVKDLWSLGVPYSREGCDPTRYIFPYVL